MPDLAEQRKRPVNLSLSGHLVDEARRYCPNLSATVDALLAEYVQRQHGARASRQQQAAACVAAWNEVHARIGSFADEHSTL